MIIDPLEPRRLFAEVGFEVDAALSHLTIAASVKAPHVGTVKLSPQAEGLDTASLYGLLIADVTSKGVKFAGESEVAATTHDGAYSPNESPADFALKGKVKKLGIKLADVKAAARDFAFDLTGPRGGLKSTGKFALKNVSLAATAGTIDYKLDSKFGDADGSKPFAGLSATMNESSGTLAGKAGARTIVVPIKVVLVKELKNNVTATFTLGGTIVGHETPVGHAFAAAPAAAPSVARASVSASLFGDDRTIL